MRASLRNTFTRAEARHGKASVRPFRELVTMKASPEQKLYMLAKAAHEAAKDKEKRLVEAITIPKPSREELQAWGAEHGTDEGGAVFGVNGQEYDPGKYCHPYFAAVREIEDRTQTSRYHHELVDAENAMVDWAREESKRVLGDRYKSIEVCFKEWPLDGVLRQKFLDIVFQMPWGGK